MTAATTGSGDLPLLTWLIILLGWYIVHRATLARERRRERRELSQKAIDAINQIERKAIDFHTGLSYSPLVAEELTYDVNRVIRKLQCSPLSCLNIKTHLFVKLRQAVSLNNADASSFTPQQPNSTIALEIRSACANLADAVESAKEREFA